MVYARDHVPYKDISSGNAGRRFQPRRLIGVSDREVGSSAVQRLREKGTRILRKPHMNSITAGCDNLRFAFADGKWIHVDPDTFSLTISISLYHQAV